MARVRLTKRMRSAADDKTPYPGEVGVENKQDADPSSSAEYETYEEYPGWELQNLNPDWKNDDRDEIGFPVRSAPTNPSMSVANVKRAASKAVKLAVLLLGTKSPEEEIEEQAKTFMRLGMSGLDASLKRYASTEGFYAADMEQEIDRDEADKPAEEEVIGIKAGEEEETEEETEEVETASVEEPVVAEEEVVEEDVVVEEPVVEDSGVELDVEMTDTEDDAEMTAEEEELLSSLYGEEEMMPEVMEEEAMMPMAEEEEIFVEEEPVVEPAIEEDACVRKASRQGVKKLGGQPKVASSKSDMNLSDLWKSSPDVSEVFNQ